MPVTARVTCTKLDPARLLPSLGPCWLGFPSILLVSHNGFLFLATKDLKFIEAFLCQEGLCARDSTKDSASSISFNAQDNQALQVAYCKPILQMRKLTY